MRRVLLAGAGALALAGCQEEAQTEPASTPQKTDAVEMAQAEKDGDSIQVAQVTPDPIAAALLDGARTQEARDRDIGRKPGQILRLAKIEPGQTVADIASSADYYAPILSKILGAEGELIMVGPKRLEEFFPQGLESIDAYANADDSDNVVGMRIKLDEIAFDKPVDRVLNILFYHDTYWTGVDRAAMNKAIFEALKPGGYYLIIDHAAKPGAGDDVARDLHRMDPALVRPEIEAAGFVLAAQSDILANPDDPMEEGVFGALRGKTNRFVFLFQKPE